VAGQEAGDRADDDPGDEAHWARSFRVTDFAGAAPLCRPAIAVS
jgi:hypothetical protein